MNFLPVYNSPDNVYAEGIENWANTPYVNKALPGLVNLVAYQPIALFSLVYNAFAFFVKFPVTLCRYTIGYIPTARGRLMDQFPEDSKASHMAAHAYKIFGAVLDFGPLYPLAVIRPQTNILVHRKLKLIPYERPLPPLPVDIPPPPEVKPEKPILDKASKKNPFLDELHQKIGKNGS